MVLWQSGPHSCCKSLASILGRTHHLPSIRRDTNSGDPRGCAEDFEATSLRRRHYGFNERKEMGRERISARRWKSRLTHALRGPVKKALKRLRAARCFSVAVSRVVSGH